MIRLSILDQSLIGEGETAADTLQHTVNLAKMAEECGYHRFWVAEHHNNDEIAGSAPEVLLGYLAASTKEIRLASGGVMLQHYSPYKVAEQFHLLSALAPGRIDLGVGKAPGGFQLSTDALQAEYEKPARQFDEKLEELTHFIRDDFPDTHRYAALHPAPRVEQKPGIFLLGGSAESAISAAKLGISFVFAYFINGEEEVLKEARRAFDAHLPTGSEAEFHLAPAVFAAHTKEEAEKHIVSRESIKVVLQDGRRVNVSTREQAEAYLENVSQPYEILVQKTGVIAGTKEEAAEELNRLSDTYDINDFVIFTPIKNAGEKQLSYQLLSDAVLAAKR
ncbi:LLM class flavin-dependent oxidoreductase [Bacillus inaquosorum]|uniref:LLM class flavin-dependent oxidoreductase n=1 Tax=Bacillus inaquosorum TaxID=483913 RepID=UPI0022832B27|nr:LLM class flavin-dependent oxidoreductase [Bacillus inaquosorum]MCY8495324.1 LLM class flavin-dependent oxidoreductase [Bacillus inaquosorum]MCY8695343.1 LLM class flavin-dependent oxidoreductase [Bacillus inaquosorum]